MIDKESQAGERNAQPAERRNYYPPELKVFGPVGALTQGGTGMSPENPAMMGIDRLPMN